MTTSPTPVGHVIPKGAAIPDDVTGVRDQMLDVHVRGVDGLWYWPAVDEDTAPWTGEFISAEYGPLTVTAVREPEPLPATMLRKTDVDLSDAEPDTLDADAPLVDLITRYGAPWFASGMAAQRGSAPSQKHSEREAQTVLRRIEARLSSPAPQPDSSVLSLPEVPEGTVALIGGNTGRRYSRKLVAPDNDVMWFDASETPVRLLSFGQVLMFERSVSVVMREPRTWPRLDDAPEDLPKARGVSGTAYVRQPSGLYAAELGRDLFDPDREMVLGLAHKLAHWQVVDGPLTEVFDEPGGAGGQP